jgi:DNA mismatch repair ATPase MutS
MDAGPTADASAAPINQSMPVGATSNQLEASTAAAAAAAAAADSPGEHIEFMYKLTPGVAHRSFGLNVARMAGVPTSVVRRAGLKVTFGC